MWFICPGVNTVFGLVLTHDPESGSNSWSWIPQLLRNTWHVLWVESSIFSVFCRCELLHWSVSHKLSQSTDLLDCRDVMWIEQTEINARYLYIDHIFYFVSAHFMSFMSTLSALNASWPTKSNSQWTNTSFWFRLSNWINSWNNCASIQQGLKITHTSDTSPPHFGHFIQIDLFTLVFICIKCIKTCTSLKTTPWAH